MSYKYSSNPHKLYRNPGEGIFVGVCAGLSNYFDISKTLIRFLVIIACLINFPLTIITYIALAFILELRPKKIYSNEAEEDFWREVAFTPKNTFGNLRYRFRSMDERLKKMEDYVTSSEYELNNKYKDL